ncbi:MAG: ParB/RepB/Spo0J family partition protein [Kiritimatiellae bacterium]|nr:ParB/RepB/Spo0J family partition protein [Kiritimatiellia bacterium]
MKTENTNESAVGHVFAIDPARIRRSPFQVRRAEAPDADLAANIAAHGLVHPVTVRPLGDSGDYELIAGHRRFAAYCQAFPGAAIPATVLDVDDRAAEDMLVSENFMRLDLSVVEKAVSIKQLKDHGRSVAEVAALVRMSERTVFRFLAIGNLARPWQEFLHAWDATYAETLRIARLPPAVQRDAWTALLEYLADMCDYGAPKGNKEAQRERSAFVEAMDGRKGDKAEFLDYMRRATTPVYVPDVAVAEIIVRDWFTAERGLVAILGEKRLLDPKTCPFDCARECRGCSKRSDVQADLFDDAGARAIPRCHDGECWRAKAAAAAAKKATSGTDGNKEVPALAPPSATSSDALPESGKKEGLASLPERDADSPGGPASLSAGPSAPVRASSSSPAPESWTAPTGESPTSVGAGAGGNDRSPARAEVSSNADVAVRMGAVWFCAAILNGETLENILPSIGALKADEVRRGGWRAAVEQKALPRLRRNRDEAAGVLKALAAERMW